MTKYFLAVLTGLTLLMGSTAANAATKAVATTDVNLRAGPGTHYPVIKVVPQTGGLITFGCLADYSWCDVRYSGHRGWLAARYIKLIRPGAVITPATAVRVGVPVIRFNQAYWRAHYAAYPWVHHWSRYVRPVKVAPYPARRGVKARCYGAGCSGSATIVGPRGGTVTRSFSINR